MNLESMTRLLERIDPEGVLSEGKGDRRAALRTFGLAGAGIAAAAVPAIFSGLIRPRPAAAQENGAASVEEVLSFALTLEYLEHDFYERGLAEPGLIPGEDRPLYQVLRDHELAHVRFLEDVLGIPRDRDRPTFDFTAGGIFPWQTDYGVFRALTQGFEDTGVRAYKGQAANPNVMANPGVLTAALQIHSVEGRHASMIRRRNGDFQEMAPQKGWPTGRDPGVVPASVNGTAVGDAIYGPGNPPEDFPAEDNVVHAGVDLRELTYDPPIEDEDALSEAFDEPLDMGTVLAIAGLFLPSD